MSFDLKEIIQIFADSNLSSLKLEQESLKLELSKENLHTPLKEKASPQKEAFSINEGQRQEVQEVEERVEESFSQVKSPVVGIFYPKKDPSSPPFVRVGEEVKEGQVLCLVEAMKMFNEIKSPYTGVVRKVNPGEGDLVEFDQVLFEIEERR